MIFLRLVQAETARNEMAEACNSTSDWMQQTQKKLEKSWDAIQLGKQYVKNLTDIDEQVS